ncbi:Proline-rich receptor-like protein kinase PERK8 [Glycine soja]|nr:Proline-rich receptor-like protein kinase PERK8 [Glycine soja]
MSMDHSPPASASYVVVACDATRDRTEHEIKLVVDHVRARRVFLSSGDKLLVLCVLHKVSHPMGYQTLACPESFAGTNFRAMEDEVKKKVDAYATELLSSYEDFESEGVSIEVKVTAGFPIKHVVLQEVTNYNASWVILDRHLRRDLRYHLNKMPCKVALVKDDLSLDIWRSHYVHETKITETKCVYSLSKFVSLADCHSVEDIEHSIISCKSYPHSIFSSDGSSTIRSYTKQSSYGNRSRENSSLSDFGSSSKQERTGEGGYGHVYNGVLKDGQQIAAKVRKEESSHGPGFLNFILRCVLSFSRHKNIVMLLGYCCKEKKNILIYEYICNKSLHWHLFENNEAVLEWHQRYAIAIGTAKELRFLHEECRGGPIIHRDMRPSNRLLTHDFVPMLGDFGLAKWKTGDDTLQTRIMGTLGYLAPEYAEDGIVSVGTDVYSYGIILLQLISGRQVGNSNNPEQQQQQSLRQWAEPMIKNLALHELIDTHLGESYDTYELYLMAKAAYFCVQRKPEMRPSMGEVVRLLEGESSHFHSLEDQFATNYNL